MAITAGLRNAQRAAPQPLAIDLALARFPLHALTAAGAGELWLKALQLWQYISQPQANPHPPHDFAVVARGLADLGMGRCGRVRQDRAHSLLLLLACKGAAHGWASLARRSFGPSTITSDPAQMIA